MPSSKTLNQGGGAWAAGTAQSVKLGAVGAGATQATATAIVYDATTFTTVAASTGALLPKPTVVGESYLLANWGANALSLYPPLGHAANNGAANAAVSVAAGKAAHATYIGSLKWIVVVSA